LDAGHLHGRRFKQNSGEEQAALGPLACKVSCRPQHQNCIVYLSDQAHLT
jgi:hypothetical protein